MAWYTSIGEQYVDAFARGDDVSAFDPASVPPFSFVLYMLIANYRDLGAIARLLESTETSERVDPACVFPAVYTFGAPRVDDVYDPVFFDGLFALLGAYDPGFTLERVKDHVWGHWTGSRMHHALAEHILRRGRADVVDACDQCAVYEWGAAALNTMYAVLGEDMHVPMRVGGAPVLHHVLKNASAYHNPVFGERAYGLAGEISAAALEHVLARLPAEYRAKAWQGRTPRDIAEEYNPRLLPFLEPPRVSALAAL